MGNKFTFVLLFFVFSIGHQFVTTSIAQAGSNVECSAVNATDQACLQKKAECEKWGTGAERKKWVLDADTKVYGCQAVKTETEVVVKSCGKYAKSNPNYNSEDDNSLACMCTHDNTILFDRNKGIGNADSCPKQPIVAKQCVGQSTDELHDKVKGDPSKGKENHCVCKYASNWGESPREYPRDTTPENEAKLACPASAPKEEVATKDTMNEQVFDCIEDVKAKVNACKIKSSETLKTCDMKSEKNAEVRQPIASVMGLATNAMHSSAVNKGAVEQCKNAGLLSAAAGYGLGQIKGHCEKEIKACQDECAEVKDYNVEKIVQICHENKGAGSDAASDTALREQAQKLVAVAEDVDQECFQEGSDMSPTAKSLLNSVAQGIAQAVSANQSAVQCEQVISSKPALVPFTSACATNPNAAGCPVNCATNPSHAQCFCMTNPNDATCKGGGGSQLAGNPNGNSQYTPIGVNLGSSKIGSTTSGGGGLGNLDMGDASELNPLDQKPTAENQKEASMFGQATAANGGGTGAAGGGGDGQAKNGKLEAPGEERGLIGGVFQTLKNAAGSLFGGGSAASSAKKPSAINPGVNAAGLKPITGNQALRGVASNGKSCFVDAKGTEYCFGRKNMDIFKMMNAQYNNQYNTLIIDK